MNIDKFSKDELILCGYGGSIAYGTNVPGSDTDIRGIKLSSANDILGCLKDPEQFVSNQTDTVIYSLNKMIKLFCSCNPNAIEILGLLPEHYLQISPEGQLLLDNAHLFLSRQAVNSFGGYAMSQLNRLINKSGRGTQELTANETRSLKKAINSFSERYAKYGYGNSKVTAEQKDTDIMISMNLTDVPMNVVLQILNEFASINKDYSSSTRNTKAAEHHKLSKHMMHLIRLYMMGTDILLKEQIITYRGNDHELLMSIRNGDYLEADQMTPTKAFEELLTEYQAKFNEAKAATKLPDNPDMNAVNELVKKINLMQLRRQADLNF